MSSNNVILVLKRLGKYIKHICVGAFIVPMLFWMESSFGTVLPAPLSPEYLTTCGTGSLAPCNAQANQVIITSAPIAGAPQCGLHGTCGTSQLIGYTYTSQVTGTTPAYYTTCGTGSLAPCNAQANQVIITSAPIAGSPLCGIKNACGSSQLIGYKYSSQVVNTAPAYLTICGTGSLAPCSGQMNQIIITSAPIAGSPLCSIKNTCGSSQLIGYVYPTIPSSTGFTVYPKYFIGSVVYVPPGQGPSSVTYGAGTVTGTTVSTTSSWNNDSSAGLSFGDFSITFGNNFGGSTLTSVDMQNTSSQSTTYKGQTSNLINHDYDQIQLFLGVKIQASVDYIGHVTWGADFSQIANQGFAETGYPISVGCLRSSSSIPISQCVATINFLNSVGITAADYPNILGADPFADPNASLLPNHDRYVLVDAVNFLPNPTTSTFTYNESNSTTITNAHTSSYSYFVSASVSASYDGFSLKASDKFTWTNSSTTSNKTGSNSSSAFTLSLPSSPYSGPSTLFVYVDTIYKTFMFSFNQ